MNLKAITRGPLAGKYAVSDCGQVINCQTGRVLRPDQTTTNRGKAQTYYRVNLFVNNKGYKFAVHRLVAMAFLPNPDNKPEVNHIDGDRSNNQASNLEWVTKSENMQHAAKTGLASAGSMNGMSKYTEAQIQQVLQCSAAGLSRKEVSEITGVSISMIKDVRMGRAWTHVQVV